MDENYKADYIKCFHKVRSKFQLVFCCANSDNVHESGLAFLLIPADCEEHFLISVLHFIKNYATAYLDHDLK